VINVWLVVSVLLMVANACIHLASVCRWDVESALPGVWVFHSLTMAIFAVALLYGLIYSPQAEDKPDFCMPAAPKWSKVLFGVLMAYTLLNFFACKALMEGGRPSRAEDGTYRLMDRSRVIRECSEAEYHLHRSYASRMFSGHWILFSAGAMMVLLGARRHQRGLSEEKRAKLEAETEGEPDDDAKEQAERGASIPLSPVWAIGIYLALLFGVVVSYGVPGYALGAIACLVAMGFGVVRLAHHVQLRRLELFETMPGCFGLLPSLVLIILMTGHLSRFLYILLAVGPIAALTGSVEIATTLEGPHMLTNGVPINGGLSTALMMLAWPVGGGLSLVGLLGLLDAFGHGVTGRWERSGEVEAGETAEA